MKQKNISIIVIIGLFVVGFIMPAVLKQYYLNMLTEIIIIALFAVSYNLLLGYAGLLSFGHAAFFGLGAFTTAVSIIHIPGLSLWSAVLISVLMTVVRVLFWGACF